MDDYQMVMPLPLCKIGGVKVVSNPFLLPFVTIYSQIIPSSDTIREFFVAIPYGQVKLNLLPFNGFPKISDYSADAQGVVAFDLIMDYDSVDIQFASLFDVVRYAKWEGHFSIVRSQNLGDYLAFRSAFVQKNHAEETNLKRVVGYALRFKSAGIYCAFDRVNMPVAMLVMLKSDNRLAVVDTACRPDEAGRCALFFILRHVIRVNAESNLVLSFPENGFFLSEHSKPFCTHGMQYKKGVMRFI